MKAQDLNAEYSKLCAESGSLGSKIRQLEIQNSQLCAESGSLGSKIRQLEIQKQALDQRIDRLDALAVELQKREVNEISKVPEELRTPGEPSPAGERALQAVKDEGSL